jgi:hypothetical protein
MVSVIGISIEPISRLAINSPIVTSPIAIPYFIPLLFISLSISKAN